MSFAEESALAVAHIRKLDSMAAIARNLAETIERQEFTARCGTIGGVATSIISIGGGQVIGAATFTHRQLGTVAVVSAVVSAAMFLQRSPLPAVIEVDE